MKRFFILLGSLFFLFCMIVVAAGLWVNHTIYAPSSFDQDTEFMIEPGTSGYTIAQQLAEKKLISHPELFYILLRINPAIIQAGEYQIPAYSNMESVLSLLQSGAVITRSVTLAEGMTVKQAIRLLKSEPLLQGDVSDKDIPEGSLLPETYHFTRGDTRAEILQRMRQAHDNLVNKLWDERDPSLPLKNINEMVTLASIVEKETGIAHERARIAGLFYNRLKRGMMLQTDPTVVYVITHRLGHMEGKPLLLKHLAVDSPYNTYRVVGLPPGPIANPGKASLEAVLKPEKHDYLYFVADGSGGHVFGKTLADHNRNVQQWRKIKRTIQTQTKLQTEKK